MFRRYIEFLTVLLFSFALKSFQIPEDYSELKCELVRIEKPPRPDTRAFPKDKEHRITPHLPISFGTSTNWAGYVGATNMNKPSPKTVKQVHATWNVPTIYSSNIKTYCSIWVGIDGYSSPTVEQIGTEHDWSNGAQINYAWFEMYPDYAYMISGFPVQRGDSISAKVFFEGNNSFVLTISNNTRKVYMTIPKSYTQSSVAQRSCAEWVVEAPYLNGILPLAHFSNIRFFNSCATIGNVWAPIKNNNWQHASINMINNNNVIKAKTTELSANGRSFAVLWKHQ